jgi:hypothetical protein
MGEPLTTDGIEESGRCQDRQRKHGANTTDGDYAIHGKDGPFILSISHSTSGNSPTLMN